MTKIQICVLIKPQWSIKCWTKSKKLIRTLVVVFSKYINKIIYFNRPTILFFFSLCYFKIKVLSTCICIVQQLYKRLILYHFFYCDIIKLLKTRKLIRLTFHSEKIEILKIRAHVWTNVHIKTAAVINHSKKQFFTFFNVNKTCIFWIATK